MPVSKKRYFGHGLLVIIGLSGALITGRSLLMPLFGRDFVYRSLRFGVEVYGVQAFSMLGMLFLLSVILIAVGILGILKR